MREKHCFELFDLTGKKNTEKQLILFTVRVHRCRARKRELWHKNIYPDQVWLDGLYMCQPFYMEYETCFHDKKNYDDIFPVILMLKKIRDPKTGLYYHAYDSSRAMFWCDRVTGLSQNFWSRRTGLVFHGTARYIRQNRRISRGRILRKIKTNICRTHGCC